MNHLDYKGNKLKSLKVAKPKDDDCGEDVV